MNSSLALAEHPARVLIVDDEAHNRELMKVMLVPEGYDILTANTGEEALAMVVEHPPDLVLLDIMLPGMNGYEVARRLKANDITRNIPIIMITALDDRAARMRGLTAGAEDFLTKPVDRAELCLRVRNLLQLKAYGDYHDKYSQLLEQEIGLRTADLAASERLYRSTFDAAPVGIGHIALDGRWIHVNQRLCDLLGYTKEELLGIEFQELMRAEAVPGEAESFLKMVAGELDRFVIDERRYPKRDGSFIWGRVNTSVHRDANGQPQHFIVVIEDITEHRTLEAQVRQVGKMDAIGHLASGVAHDFNNLLTVILGFTDLMNADTELADAHREDLSEIVKAAHRAAGLTKQLLAYSRQQVLRGAPLNVNELITQMTGMLDRLIGERIGISLVLGSDLPLAFADRSQLEQVVMNLVVNARDAMPNGGTVTIETTDVELENSAFHDEPVLQGRYVMVAITDTGVGMSKETQRHVFEPFFTTKEVGKGTGLGLSTTYGIVKQSKGYIWVYSEAGQGTTFKVYLPHSKNGHAPEAESVVERAKTASETLLLVEDETSVRALAKRILEKAGYHVLEAASGEAAEVLFGQHSDRILMVVTDVSMPGCDGPELLVRLHEQRPGLKVLYMSGYPARSSKAMTGGEAELAFLQKPFTAAELTRRVRETLDK